MRHSDLYFFIIFDRCIQLDICVFFLFQAEDGIRYGTVTGVQTCALPISRGSGACCKIASPANCGWLKLPTSTPPTPCCASSSPTTTAVLPGCLAKTPPPGAPLLKVSNGSPASSTNAPSATTTSSSGHAAAARSPSRRAASASPAPKCTSTKLSMGGGRSTTETHASNTRPSQGGDIFTLPLG